MERVTDRSPALAVLFLTGLLAAACGKAEPESKPSAPPPLHPASVPMPATPPGKPQPGDLVGAPPPRPKPGFDSSKWTREQCVQAGGEVRKVGLGAPDLAPVDCGDGFTNLGEVVGADCVCLCCYRRPAAAPAARAPDPRPRGRSRSH